MQIFALDKNFHPVEAAHALKGTDYTCVECQNPLRVRKGPLLIAHYYHFKSSPSCSQEGKSLTHLKLQLALKKKLGAKLEVFFPTIKRIADVVWEEKKIIFEIQISPLSGQEALDRINDYRSQGYEVVWLLYDRSYNQLIVSDLEKTLATHPHYFTDGKIFYDQLSLIRKRTRLKKLFKREIELSQPIIPDKDLFQRNWSLSFENDLYNAAFLNPKELEEYTEFKRDRTSFSLMKEVWRYFLLKGSG